MLLFHGIWDRDEHRFDDNLYYQADGRPVHFGGLTFAQWQALGQDRHSLIADPRFVDPADGNFSLKPGSPAFKIGFKPIDTSDVGPR